VKNVNWRLERAFVSSCLLTKINNYVTPVLFFFAL